MSIYMYTYVWVRTHWLILLHVANKNKVITSLRALYRSASFGVSQSEFVLKILGGA
jgi:hypothetical protein